MKEWVKKFEIGDTHVLPGQTTNIKLKISETYVGSDVSMPVRIMRAKKKGPTVFVTAAIHGDEVNGTGIIHELMFGEHLTLLSGALILVPVVNVFGFETGTRYMPDGRDLNRSFPGSPNGSLSSRYAYTLMNEIVKKCDYGIDLHSASGQRTNYPNIRADTKNKTIHQLALDFGATLVVDGKGPEGAFRRECCKSGCPTIILEAGEPHKIEPSVLQIGIFGVKNILRSLGMIKGESKRPDQQLIIKTSTWVRAELGGILRFHVLPGDIIKKGQPIATNVSIFGKEKSSIISPKDGVVLGMATLPAVKPGEPICHIGVPSKSFKFMCKALDEPVGSLHHQVKIDLATNISISKNESYNNQ